MTQQDKIRDQEAIFILEQKSTTKKPKGIMVFNGKPTREWFSREDTSSTTSSLEAILKTEKIAAYEGRYIMDLYVPNTFIQTYIPPKKYDE